MAPNILFIMYDQHPTLRTPNFDRVAARGVRFNRAYCQSPVCGASRMSTYTGRYVSSHGASFNNFPLKVGEMTIGDHLRKAGMGCWLIGKTHMKADVEGMAWLGLSHDSVIGARVEECGFDVWIRDEGLWAEGPAGFYDQKRSPYNEYLKAKGYPSANPWHDNANAGVTDEGDIASGFLVLHADKPANIREEDSETPWLTSRTIDFIETLKGKAPWCAHVSFIKPHWPYIVPAPYHDMYGHNHIKPVVRSEDERRDPHPVFGASDDHADLIAAMYDKLFCWVRRQSQCTTISDAQIAERRKGGSGQVGILLGLYGDEEIPPDHLTAYSGKATPVDPS